MCASIDTVGGGIVLQSTESSSDEAPVEAVYRCISEARPERDVISVVYAAVRRVPGINVVSASQGYSRNELESSQEDSDSDDFLGEERNFRSGMKFSVILAQRSLNSAISFSGKSNERCY